MGRVDRYDFLWSAGTPAGLTGVTSRIRPGCKPILTNVNVVIWFLLSTRRVPNVLVRSRR